MLDKTIVDKHLRKALLNASRSLLKNKHGCVIFKDSQVLSVGHNKMINLWRLRHYGYNRTSLHAEADALIKERRCFEGMCLLVVRLGKTKLRNSKPCKSCMAMIKEAGISTVFFSTQLGTIEEMVIS